MSCSGDLGVSCNGVENTQPAPLCPTSPEFDAAYLNAAILSQVEFYFGDANLPRDQFLLGEMAKHPDGFVSLATIAGFKRMKSLTRDLQVVVGALQLSELIELNVDCTMIRRRFPLPEHDEGISLSVVADNLPSEPTIESMMEIFSTKGSVTLIRILTPNKPIPEDLKLLQHASLRSPRTVAVVQYSKRGEAERAARELTHPSDWRAGMRVQLLQQGPKRGFRPELDAQPVKRTSPTNSMKGGKRLSKFDKFDRFARPESADNSIRRGRLNSNASSTGDFEGITFTRPRKFSTADSTCSGVTDTTDYDAPRVRKVSQCLSEADSVVSHRSNASSVSDERFRLAKGPDGSKGFSMSRSNFALPWARDETLTPVVEAPASTPSCESSESNLVSAVEQGSEDKTKCGSTTEAPAMVAVPVVVSQ